MRWPPSASDGEDGAGHGFPRFMDAITAFSKPLIAAVNGVGVGLGFTIVGHCDLVLVSEEARFKTPFTSLGVAPEAASSYLFPLLIGWQDAAHILLTSRWVAATEAVDLGLAWRLCRAEDLMAETLAVAGEIAAMPVASLVATKRVMKAARSDAGGRRPPSGGRRVRRARGRARQHRGAHRLHRETGSRLHRHVGPAGLGARLAERRGCVGYLADLHGE